MRVRIRSVTVHGVLDSWWDAEHVARVLGELTRAARRVAEGVARRSGLEVWTVRVALPPAPRGAAGSLVEAWRTARGKGLIDSNVLYSLYHVDAYAAGMEDVEAVLGLSDSVYASVAAPEPEPAGELLYRLALLGPDASSRVAVTVPGHVETPYFPAATTLSSTPGVSIALLYPALLRGRGPWEALPELLEVLDRVEDAVAETLQGEGLDWLDFYGFDLSLSPWMDDSVAGVLEEASGARVGELGFAAAIAEAEEMIAEACEETLCTGFNQVMLPVAEDNVLKERAAEGRLTLALLAAYSYACVAGIDMTLVPGREWTPQLAARLLRELAMASSRKNAPLAARIIAVDANPGEWVELPRFGRTPVARVA